MYSRMHHSDISETYSYVVFKLDSSRRIKINLFQSLSNNIIWLSLTSLCSFDRSGLVDVSLIVDIEFTESILQAEDLILLELRIFPARRLESVIVNFEPDYRPREIRYRIPLQLDNIHLATCFTTSLAIEAVSSWMNGRSIVGCEIREAGS
jgi:hypothetical protein